MVSAEGGQNFFVRILAGRPFFLATVSHLFFAFFLFSPFFLEGKILIGSTDNYFGTWVNYLFSRDRLANGDLGLWNPNVLGGIDFTASPHNHLLCPLDWPLFLLPRELFFQGLTIQVFLLVFLTGPFAYLFFREELGNGKWAYLASLIYQAGGFTLFSITTYSNTQLYCLNIVTLYLIWTADRRRPIHAYALWTLCLALIIVAGNPLYSFAIFLLMLVLFVYRHWPTSITVWRPRGVGWTFYSAAATAVVLTAVHWLPVGHALFFAGSRMRTVGLPTEWGRTFLGVGAFVPEAFGIHFSESVRFLTALQAGGHAQFHGYPFYGVASALLVVLALTLRVPRVRFWLPFLLICSAWHLRCPPISAILDFLFYPVVHDIIPKEMITIGVCAVAAHAAVYLERNCEQSTARMAGILFGTLYVVGAVVVTVWAFPHSVASVGADPHSITTQAHILALYKGKGTVLAGLAVLLGVGHLLRRGNSWKLWPAAILLAIGPLGVALVYTRSRSLGLLDHPFYCSSFAFLAIAILAGTLLATALLACERGRLSRVGMIGCCLVLVIGVAGACLWPSLGLPGPMDMPHLTQTLTLGLVKFAVFCIGLFLLLAALARRPELRPLLFPCLCTLLVIDLLPYNKNYSRQISEAFVRQEDLYPDRSCLLPAEEDHALAAGLRGSVPNNQRIDFANYAMWPSTRPHAVSIPNGLRLDLANYRVNRPHVVLGLEGMEYYSNLPSFYGVRSYAGMNSDYPPGLIGLLQRLESAVPPTSIGANGIVALQTRSVLLDLLGCGYDLDDADRLTVRPTALARFMLFRRFEVVPDRERILDRLAEKTFVARDGLFLEAGPGIAPADTKLPAQMVRYTNRKTSELHIMCETPTPALLFFGDNYHPGWEAYLNGHKQRMLRADYSFMAVPVPAGKSAVILQFRPRPFFAGVALSVSGLAGFLAVLLTAWIWRRQVRVLNRKTKRLR